MPAALLVIDAQPTLLGVADKGASVLARCRLAVAGARLLGLPVLLTEQAPGKLGATEPSLLAAAGETPLVFPKTAFSALAAEGLLEALRDRSVDHLLLAGVEGPICVHQTAVQAMAEDFGVTLLGDAIGARRAEDQALSLEALRRAGAHVLSVETVLYSLMGGADHPRFKEIAGLVKAGGR